MSIFMLMVEQNIMIAFKASAINIPTAPEYLAF